MNEQVPLRAQLAGGDRRSIGGSDKVAENIASRPAKFAETITLMSDDDPIVPNAGELDRHKFVVGEYITVKDVDDEPLVYRVDRVEPLR